MTSLSCDTPTRGRPTTKKALVIGVGYREPVGELGPIPTSIPNVKKFAGLLRECGYTSIIEMTDEDGVEERYQPTEINLRREIKALGNGVEPGDRRVFYFAGHSDQTPCRSDSEEDGMDEVLVTADGFKIRDNSLYNLLVEGLPKGSALTAVFDSCTSGTLLDLRHYKCNNVYHPWVNKGQRRSVTLQNRVVRKDCGPPNRRRSTYTKKRSRKTGSQSFSLDHLATQTMDGDSTAVMGSFTNDLDHHYGQTCMSPERRYECDGLCREPTRRRSTFEYADVISISSSNDGQISWDASTRNGDSISMTAFLVNILKEYPQLTLTELMTRLKHKEHSFMMKMHDAVKREKRARKAEGMNTDSDTTDPGEEIEGEMNNFQDIQLGSMTPLDMNRLFVP